MTDYEVTVCVQDPLHGDRGDLQSHLVNKLTECGYEVKGLEVKEETVTTEEGELP